MADPVPFKDAADKSLSLSRRPRPTTRLNRRTIAIASGIVVIAMFALASIALDKNERDDLSARSELYNVASVRPPDALKNMPDQYQPVAKAFPILGPPQSGDIGMGLVELEKDLGIKHVEAPRYTDRFVASPEEDLARAARIESAKLAQEAARAPVFFEAVGSTTGPAHPASFPITNQPATPSELFDQSAPDQMQTPSSPYQIMAGTIIPASLITGLNSDLPGAVIAQVTAPVFDSVTGGHTLIPQGARLIGRYNADQAYGQSRAAVTWERIIFPDGRSVRVSMPATDARGYAGLTDRVDHHWDRLILSAGLATVLSIGAEASNDASDDLERAFARGAGRTISDTGQRIVDRGLGIAPTITIRPGARVQVLVTRDLTLPPPQ